ARRRIILRVVVVAFAQADDFEIGKLFSQDVAKAHFALLMTAIAEASDNHRDLAGAPADEPAQQVARRPSGRPIVDADIAEAARVRQIRDHGQYGNASVDEAIDGLAHLRMLNRDKGDA